MNLSRTYCGINIFILLGGLFYSSVFPSNNEGSKQLKLLVLVIASDNRQVYIDLQKAWRSYMHSDPDRVQAYFIKCNPLLEKDYEVEGDTIWCKAVECERPGIINKTLLSLQALMPVMDQFDYVLRTNLSSFYIFDRLFKVLEESPRTKFCCGSFFHWYQYQLPSGCGYVISVDLAKSMCEQKDSLMNNAAFPDDAISGFFVLDSGASFVIYHRLAIWDLEVWNNYKNSIPEDIFQIRVKNNFDFKRELEDAFIYRQLVDRFYPSK